MKLTARQIDAEKKGTKRKTLSDGHGLLLEISTSGSKFWIVRYYPDGNGKEHRKHIGQYPEMSIAQAREITQRIKQQAKNRESIATAPKEKTTFRTIAEEWYSVRMLPRSPSHYKKIRCRLDKHILPEIGNFEMHEIKASRILDICRKLEKEGKTDSAHRVKQAISQIFKFAMLAEKAEADPTSALSGMLQPHELKHYPTLTKEHEIEQFIKAIDNYTGSRSTTRIALLFSVLTFARPGEVRKAEWSEINFKDKEWITPAHKMKTKEDRIVPLSTQVIALLQELKKDTYYDGNIYLFPSERRDGRTLSENTINNALRVLNYSREQLTAHGFRAMASTILNERLKYKPDVIERQLAHKDTNTVRSAYNRSEYIDERREMMQRYADYLYELKDRQPPPPPTPPKPLTPEEIAQQEADYEGSIDFLIADIQRTDTDEQHTTGRP